MKRCGLLCLVTVAMIFLAAKMMSFTSGRTTSDKVYTRTMMHVEQVDISVVSAFSRRKATDLNVLEDVRAVDISSCCISAECMLIQAQATPVVMLNPGEIRLLGSPVDAETSSEGKSSTVESVESRMLVNDPSVEFEMSYKK